MPELTFDHVIIDADNPANPHCKAAGDLSGDGVSDVAAASASGGGLFWYRWPDWRKTRIAEGSFTTDMAIADIDGDGHGDVVIPSHEGLMVYRNPLAAGGDPTRDPWEAINVSAEGAKMHDVEPADLDGDGRLDLVTRHQSGFGHAMGNRIYLWYQRSLTDWDLRTFDCPHGEGLAVADIDGDGYPDVIIGGRWYRNPGGDPDGTWQACPYMPAAHFEARWTDGDVVVAAGDVTGDGQLEIVVSAAEGAGQLAWYEARAEPMQPDWTEHVIEAQIDHSHGLALGDVDGDGSLDIVVAKMHQASPPQSVALYCNDGGGASWTRQELAVTGSHNIALADFGAPARGEPARGEPARLSVVGANWNERAAAGAAIEAWVQRP